MVGLQLWLLNNEQRYEKGDHKCHQRIQTLPHFEPAESVLSRIYEKKVITGPTIFL